MSDSRSHNMDLPLERFYRLIHESSVYAATQRKTYSRNKLQDKKIYKSQSKIQALS